TSVPLDWVVKLRPSSGEWMIWPFWPMAKRVPGVPQRAASGCLAPASRATQAVEAAAGGGGGGGGDGGGDGDGAGAAGGGAGGGAAAATSGSECSTRSPTTQTSPGPLPQIARRVPPVPVRTWIQLLPSQWRSTPPPPAT